MKRCRICLSLLLVFLTGCLPTPADDPGFVLPDTTAEETLDAGEQPGEVLIDTPIPDPCGNLLWPLYPGIRWDYQSNQDDLTSLTTGEMDGGIPLASPLMTTTFNCLEGAIAGIPPAPFLIHPDLGSGIGWSNLTGAYLPAAGTLSPYGSWKTWSFEASPTGQITLPDENGTAVYGIESGRIVFVNSTDPLIDIATSAGTFLALPIKQQVFLDLNLSDERGAQSKVLVDVTAILYFSEGSGLIRAHFVSGSVSRSDAAYPLRGEIIYDLVSISMP